MERDEALKVWKAAAKIYGTAIDDRQVERLFDTWWRRNSAKPDHKDKSS